MSQPWMKWYPSDWRSDPAVRMCSLAARGLWMEMLCLMHEAEPSGSLVVNGKSLTARQIAMLAGATLNEIEPLLEELEEGGVFSRDADGTIFSRRIRRDIAKAEADRLNGKGGGNPKLVKRDKPDSNPTGNPPLNPKPNGGVNPPLKAQSQSPESRVQSQNPESESSSSKDARARKKPPDGGDDDDDKLISEVKSALGAKASLLVVRKGLGNVRAWIAEGLDLDGDILPELREIGRNLNSDLRTMTAPRWRQQIQVRHEVRLEALAARGGAPPPATEHVLRDSPLWPAHAAEYRAAHEGRSPPVDKLGGWRFPPLTRPPSAGLDDPPERRRVDLSAMLNHAVIH